MNTQQIKSGKANNGLHLILSLCITMALILGASAFNLFHSPTAQAAVSASLAQAPNAPQASGNISVAIIPAGTTGEVTVPVILTDADDVGAVSANIYYDDSKLQAKSCDEKNTGGQCNIDLKGGEVRFNATYPSGADGTVTITSFVFEILEASETPTSFELDVAESASSAGVPFILNVLEGADLDLFIDNTSDNGNNDDNDDNGNTGNTDDDTRKLFLPLIQK